MFHLLSLGLPLQPRDEATGTSVAFDLLASTAQPVTTGHAAGVITLDLAESDAVHRENMRTKLCEPYRTVLGHFRHEIGHFLFAVLVDDAELDDARGLFGDETRDDQAALDRLDRDGAPPCLLTSPTGVATGVRWRFRRVGRCRWLGLSYRELTPM